MSFFNTPLKHGKGVNKPFRSPLISGDKNDNSSRRLGTPLKLNQNPNMKSLGYKSPMNSRAFNSPMKLLTSSSKGSETGTHANSVDYSAPLKRIENHLLLKRPRNNSLSVSLDNSSMEGSEIKLHIKSSEKEASFMKSSEFTANVQTENLDRISIENKSQTSEEEKSTNINAEMSFENVLEVKKTPPVSPKIEEAIDSPEFQPVVKIQKLSPNILNVYKKDMILLVKKVNEKQREMAELRAKIPLGKKHNLEEIVVSIGKWREAFVEALETLRASLTEKNGRYFSTSDVLKILSIPNRIVHFSADMNDFNFPALVSKKVMS